MSCIDTKELKHNLKYVINKEKNKSYSTGEIRLIDMVQDCLKEIEKLERENEKLRMMIYTYLSIQNIMGESEVVE